MNKSFINKLNKKALAAILSVFMLLAVMLFENVVVFAEPNYDESINDAKNERDKTQGELDEVNASIEELSEEAEGVEEEIDEISAALVQVMAEITVLEGDIADKEVDIEECEKEYEKAVEVEKKQYEAMKVRIQYLYENGNNSLLKIYLESGTITEALNKADFAQDLYDYDRKMLLQYQDTVKMVNDLHEQLLAEKEELEDLREEYEEEKASMEEIMDELQAKADDYYAKIASARSLASQYSKKIKEQNKEIKRLEAEKKKAEEEARRRAEEEARRKAAEEAAKRKAAEEAARKAEEEARQRDQQEADNSRESAEAQVASAQETGTITTTNNNTYDVSSIYSSSGSDLGKSIASFACQYIGNPYVPGGTSLTDGADCSGFVFAVYKSFGYKVPRTSSSLRSAGTEVAYANAQPGDIVCYPGHVAIYIGNGMIVHASTQKTGIKISKAEYRTITCVRRLI